MNNAWTVAKKDNIVCNEVLFYTLQNKCLRFIGSLRYWKTLMTEVISNTVRLNSA